ncbi:MAG: UDP-glucose/GDP-mannose dehydrogenase family protein [Deltaproteobacteria bacterium]|nr:UDP-glucose/GDP-mannose dehydrogenase family protein [Deltaproteobacteria bacterium]
MRVTVVGTGYVGLVTGTCLADMGNDVYCQDVAEEKIDKLEKGEMPIFEPGLAELVTRNHQDGRLRFTTDLAAALANAEVCFIAVGTPPDEDGSADRRHVFGVAKAIALRMQQPLVVVVKSTVPVGTCDQVRAVMMEELERRQAGHAVEVVSNPEFLKEGKAIEDFLRPDRIVVGVASATAADCMRRLYEPFVQNGHPLLVMDVRSSEMTKYAANVMLATRISLMNELATVCERVGADIMEVRRGIGTDRRIGMSFLYAGAGYGGSCFPKDVKALSRMAAEADCPADILDAVDKVNRHQKMLLANRVLKHFGGDARGRRVGLWGLAFKPMTDDIRESPALVIIKRLVEAGATISAYDPEAMDNARAYFAGVKQVELAKSPYDAAKDADALLLVTEWGVFRSLDFERLKALMKAPVIFDGRNQYERREMKRLGFSYHGIGRPAS